MICDSTMTAPAPLPTGEALATLAHELRGPFAAILFAQELQQWLTGASAISLAPDTGSFAGLAPGSENRLAAASGSLGAERRGAGRRPVFDVFVDYRLHREDTGAIHGHRSGFDHADVLREQRDLPPWRGCRRGSERSHGPIRSPTG